MLALSDQPKNSMKKASLLLIALASLMVASWAMPALGAEGKAITLTGEGKCAKCALHETDKCQNVLQVKEDGKTVTYYLAQNKVSKGFHEDLCKASVRISVTGTMREEDGKKILTPSKITVAK
jgi:hypothetical protein